MKCKRKQAIALVISATLCMAAYAADKPHNVILFVPDGLRAQMVSAATAPNMAALRDAGVTFNNSHSLFPTFTTANASAMATGHHLGDTGDFSNTIYTGYPVPGAGFSVTPFLESDPVLGDVDEHFAGDYLNADTLLKAARKAGFNTASVGKLGPVLIFDHTERTGQQSVIVDDSTGTPNGIPLAPWMLEALRTSGIASVAPTRGENGKSGNATTAGTLAANVTQQQWFADLFNKVVLSKFKQDDKPFIAVFWSRDPDGSQHNQGDSLNQLVPGINGPTSLAAIKNADDNLRQIRETLVALGLDQTTDIVVSADHGFSTISKQSATSPSAKLHYADVPVGFIPPGFLAKDLAHLLDLPLADPDQKNAPILPDAHPKFANGVLGKDPANPLVVVAGNGGSDLIYLPAKASKAEAHALAGKVIAALLTQDYVSGLFVDSRLGKFPGTLTLSDINLQGTAVTPMPAIVVNFKSFSTGCAQPYTCAVEISDTGLQQGQGMHGSFSRADTFNFTAAYGPDFKQKFLDTAPVSNADIGKTIAAILKLSIPDQGKLLGRVMSEAMTDGKMPKVIKASIKSAPTKTGLRTILNYQQVGTTRYFDAAGFPGRTVGLDADPAVQ
ncbi:MULTISPECIES: alkaline phosphatase family protein [unclassified Undibacterium]|uniref:alkaline phosphatase family protein n=1 Tax=unclassified Undibacterium TaxID=2630295 RepID=UPI002AC8B651|nr:MULTISPECIES: alkaline phosphatase family protein [unclassified Undibacterium]MEB0139809.1 alkaline phosphatase family protein [Undibacterium sp. CCC2.1]MEB0170483.1 alkaline phosphatase family protein [Undibacterium sp. CCC1.1]MEB0174424.1 alkaline phosphatase family protein [Undibacterium sp. CCC3.4]MEB0213779.1 alkaline phosphatase family protein [Undibacterium sp. 5I2]WPX43942.1 alkaline phosphatase family protein [Undibacterium sp. CCC3.4]